MNASALDALVKSRTVLLLDQPFFGSLALKLRIVEDEAFETAATNGVELRYNPSWVLSLSRAELLGLLAHEVMHCALGHPWRRDNRDLLDWNIAGDHVINLILRDAKFLLPRSLLLNESFRGLSTEEVYSCLHCSKPPPLPSGAADTDDAKQGGGNEDGSEQGKGSGNEDGSEQGKSGNEDGSKQGKGSGDKNGKSRQTQYRDPGGCGACIDAPPESKSGMSETEWRIAVAQAAQIAESLGYGNLPGSLSRLVKEIIDPSVPWTSVLRDFVQRTAYNDYSWVPPCRQYLSHGLVLPSLVSDELPAIVIGLDTSGSVWCRDNLLDQFCRDVSAVLEAYDTTIYLVYADADIQRVVMLSRDDLPLRLEPMGGGGTDFRPVFEWIQRESIDPSCLIYLTDLEGAFPNAEPAFPVMWVVPRRTYYKPPFGQVVYMEGGGEN